MSEQQTSNENELLTDEEAAKLLKVSPRTVQRLRLAKKIKSVKVTSKISRIDRNEIKRYVERRAA
jgi:excisionase family DNA binding protein